MGVIMKNGISYSGGSGGGSGDTNSVELTQAQYNSLVEDGQVEENVTYYIIDADDINASEIVYKETTVENELDELNQKLVVSDGEATLMNCTGKIVHRIYGLIHIVTFNISLNAQLTKGVVVEVANLGNLNVYGGEQYGSCYDAMNGFPQGAAISSSGILNIKALSDIPTSGTLRGQIVFFA